MLRFLFIILYANFISFISFGGILNSDTNKIVPKDITHSFFNNITTNPAYTGIFGNHNILLKAEIDKPFMTHGDLYRPQQYDVADDDAFGKKKNNAIGLYIIDAKGGSIENASVGFSYAHSFNLPLRKSSSFYHKVRVGISLECNQFYVDYRKTLWNDQIDEAYGFIYYTNENMPEMTCKDYYSINIGAWYHNPIFYFGFAARNVTQPNISMYSFSPIPIEYNISGGVNIPLNKIFTIHPSVFINIVKGYKGELNSYSPAILADYKGKYILGLSYKDMNKITVHAGVVLLKSVTLSAACGFSTNTDIYGFGIPAYIGGDIRMNFK